MIASPTAPVFGAPLLSANPHPGLLPPEHAEALLHELAQARWARLSSEYDDPLGMLFSQRMRQWTVGWHHARLYLLVWEAPSWDEAPTWCLYEDGHLIYREQEGPSRQRKSLCEKLLESDQLPFATIAQLLEPLTHYRFQAVQREAATQAVMATILARPEVFDVLKNGLFQALEADLSNSEWPLLEVLKLHRLAHKNPLVRLFKQAVETGLLRQVRDNARLDRALSLLQDDYYYYGAQVSPIFRLTYDQAYNAFRQLITHGAWRVKLRLKVPV